MADRVELRFRLDEPDDEQDLREAAKLFSNIDIETEQPSSETEGDVGVLVIEPVSAVLVGAAILTAAQFIMTWWIRIRERPRGGTVIDLRSQPPAPKDFIYRDRDIQLGWIAIIKADGTTVIEVPKAPDEIWINFIKDVLGGVLDTTKKIAEAAKKIVSQDNVKQLTGEAS